VAPSPTTAVDSCSPSEFHGRGFYGQLAYAIALDVGPLRKVTPYARYEQRHAWFEGFTPITVDRVTGGLRVELWDSVIVKGRAARQPRARGRAQGRQ